MYCRWDGEIHQNTVLSTQQSSQLSQTRTRCGHSVRTELPPTQSGSGQPSLPRWGEAPTSSTAPAASLSSGRWDEERSLNLQPGESYQPSQGKDWEDSHPHPHSPLFSLDGRPSVQRLHQFSADERWEPSARLSHGGLRAASPPGQSEAGGDSHRATPSDRSAQRPAEIIHNLPENWKG